MAQNKKKLRSGRYCIDYKFVNTSLPLASGKVSKLFPDNHGTVRTVSVKTSEDELKRPCCKLCLIMPYESE